MNLQLAEIAPLKGKYEIVKGYLVHPLNNPIKIEDFPQDSGLYFIDNVVYLQHFKKHEFVASSWELKKKSVSFNAEKNFDIIYQLTLLKNIKEYLSFNCLGLNFLNEYKKINNKSSSFFYIKREPMSILCDFISFLGTNSRDNKIDCLSVSEYFKNCGTIAGYPPFDREGNIN